MGHTDLGVREGRGADTTGRHRDRALRSPRKRITCPRKSLVCCWIAFACPIAAALEIAPANEMNKEGDHARAQRARSR